MADISLEESLRLNGDLGAAEEVARLRASIPDDIRLAGWAVAVHNDYRLDGVPHTFWLFTKGNLCIKGEGRTDAEALNIVRKEIADIAQMRK